MPTPPAASAPAGDRWGFLRSHWPLLVVAAVYLVALALLPLGGIWINDVGNRIIQMKSIVASGYSDFSIHWPGQALDPTYDYAPIAYPFAAIRNDKLYSVYSPVFATVASPFYRLLGNPGLYVLPLAASLAMLAGVARLARELGRGRRAGHYAVLIAGLSTPIWFYSLTFWEHTLAACFCVWGVVYLVRFLGNGRRADLVGAALLPAVATYFRPELYSFSLVMLLMVVLRGPGRKLVGALVFGLATLAALVPLWIFQLAAVGAPLGLHVGTLVSMPSGIAGQIKTRPEMFYSLFCRSAVGTAWSVVLTAPFVAALLVRPRLSLRAFRVALPVSALVALAASALAWLSFWAWGGRPTPVALVGGTNSLFAVAPLLMLGLFRRRERDDVLGLLAVAYALVYWLAAPAITRWGIHWGNRYLLVLYPLLAVLAGANLADWLAGPSGGRLARRLSLAAFGLVAAASLALQVWSVDVLQRKMDYSTRLNQEVARRPEQAIVGGVWWVGQELYGEFYDKMIFFVAPGRDAGRHYGDLLRMLAEKGYSNALLVLPAGGMAGERPAEGQTNVGEQATVVSDGGLGYWDVELLPVATGIGPGTGVRAGAGAPGAAGLGRSKPRVRDCLSLLPSGN
jgi:hypothetical protein